MYWTITIIVLLLSVAVVINVPAEGTNRRIQVVPTYPPLLFRPRRVKLAALSGTTRKLRFNALKLFPSSTGAAIWP